jgi:hypothetical protein
MNGDNVNRVRREATGYFRKKETGNIRKINLMNLKQAVRIFETPIETSMDLRTVTKIRLTQYTMRSLIFLDILIIF